MSAPYLCQATVPRIQAASSPTKLGDNICSDGIKFKTARSVGYIPFLWAAGLFRCLGRRPHSAFLGCKRASEGRDGSVPARPPKTRERRAPHIRARAAENIMAGRTQDPEFRHPDTVAHMQSLTDEEAAEHPPATRRTGGVCTEYWREGGRVRCRDVGADEAFDGTVLELGALLVATEATFGGTVSNVL